MLTFGHLLGVIAFLFVTSHVGFNLFLLLNIKNYNKKFREKNTTAGKKNGFSTGIRISILDGDIILVTASLLETSLKYNNTLFLFAGICTGGHYNLNNCYNHLIFKYFVSKTLWNLVSYS
ncbi:hypothetical protein GDO78_002495 [Eleutherodactylus coqui]|uniref:Uncharacterized protein n=1 Tax=Eleutherodactylus coqui TaxID=57060 RepID=A0A8J6EY61_ELECQ|nr:hypothetical protein GDO78_002495 [Eleutherodactylus coqui]